MKRKFALTTASALLCFSMACQQETDFTPRNVSGAPATTPSPTAAPVATGPTSPSPSPSGSVNPTATPSPTPAPGAKYIVVSPKNLTLFKGETAQVSAGVFKDSVKTSDAASLSVSNSQMLSISNTGLLSAVGSGDSFVHAQFETLKEAIPVKVIKCKDNFSGQSVATVRVNGENWPNNTVDPGGADFDDYRVVISGDLLVDGYQIFSKKAQDLSVSFGLDTPGSTSQQVTLQIVDCDGVKKSDHLISSLSGSTSFKVEKGDRFNVYTVATTIFPPPKGRVTQTYSLIKEQSLAFRIAFP